MNEAKPMLVQHGIIGEWQFACWTRTDPDGEVEEWYTWCGIEDGLDATGGYYRSLGEAMITAVAHSYLGDGEDAWAQACSFARMIGMHVRSSGSVHLPTEPEWVWQPPPHQQ